MCFLHRRVVLWAERREDKPQIFAGKSGNENAKRTRKSGGALHGRKRMRLPHNKKRKGKNGGALHERERMRLPHNKKR